MMLEAIKSMTISEAEMKKRFKFTNVELIKDLENKEEYYFNVCTLWKLGMDFYSSNLYETIKAMPSINA